MTRHHRLMLWAGWLWAGIFVYPWMQIVVASAWHVPAYSWRHDYISSLGNTACELVDERFICSPLHPYMNASFVLTGVLMLVGGILLAYAYQRNRLLALGFGLQALGGIGAVIVGLVPENAGSVWHGIGAALPFLGGNLGLLIIAYAASRWPAWLRALTGVLGIIGLTALALFISQQYLGLGRGGMERVVDGAHTGWMIMFGLLSLFGPIRQLKI